MMDKGKPLYEVPKIGSWAAADLRTHHACVSHGDISAGIAALGGTWCLLEPTARFAAEQKSKKKQGTGKFWLG